MKPYRTKLIHLCRFWFLACAFTIHLDLTLPKCFTLLFPKIMLSKEMGVSISYVWKQAGKNGGRRRKIRMSLEIKKMK